jgi:hypothetical protein
MRVQPEFAPASASCDFVAPTEVIAGVNHLCVAAPRDGRPLVENVERSTAFIISCRTPNSPSSTSRFDLAIERTARVKAPMPRQNDRPGLSLHIVSGPRRSTSSLVSAAALRRVTHCPE